MVNINMPFHTIAGILIAVIGAFVIVTALVMPESFAKNEAERAELQKKKEMLAKEPHDAETTPAEEESDAKSA